MVVICSHSQIYKKVDFYFLKIGKENLDIEKIVISYPRSSYFKNINDLIQKLQKDW